MASSGAGEVVEFEVVAPGISMKEEVKNLRAEALEFAADLAKLRAGLAAVRHAEPLERPKGAPRLGDDDDYGPETADDGDPPTALLDAGDGADSSDHDDAMNTTHGHEVVKIEASCWSIPLVAGVAGLGGRTLAVLLVGLLALNGFVQGVYAFVVFTELGERQITQDYVDSLVTWRRSLAARVCAQDSGLELSASQTSDYGLFVKYAGKDDGSAAMRSPGAIMCAVSVFAFLLIMAKEIRAVVEFSWALHFGPPRSGTTRVFEHADGSTSFASISRIRYAAVQIVTAGRLCLACFLSIYGARWLVYTVSLTELLLNAVALEFVVNIDELIWSVLVPTAAQAFVTAARPIGDLQARARARAKRTAPAASKTWRGRKALRSAPSRIGRGASRRVEDCSGVNRGAWLANVGVAIVMVSLLVHLRREVLMVRKARDALCGGDQAFVYALDGAGVPAWGYPDGAAPSKRNTPEYGDNLHSNHQHRTSAEKVIDYVIDQHGRGDDPVCALFETCFHYVDGVHEPKPGRPSCCLVQAHRVPQVDAGIFSVRQKSTESVMDAVALWNPSCIDAIGFSGGYTDLLRRAVADDVNRWVWLEDPQACGGRPPDGAGCPESKPMCSQKTGECIRPMCTDLAEHCHESSVVGIRARQYCPATCGCDDPRSPLVLSMPESGCGYQCARNGAYLERLAGIPCEDVAPDDADLQEILADGLSVSESWPADWKTAYSMFTHGMTVHGCHYLNASFLATLPDPPVYWPYDNAINMCAGRGAYFPLKALSYFCPVVCGCRAGDAHCPPSCPERKPQSPICPGYMRDYYTGWCPMAQGHHADRTAG